MSNLLGVDSQYYSIYDYNNTLLPRQGQVDLSFQAPFLAKQNDWQVSLGKASIPNQLIPLSNKNIPLRFYSVILRQGALEGQAYVQQINASTQNFVFNLGTDGSFQSQTYSDTGVLSSTSTTFNISSSVSAFNLMVVDAFQNLYVSGNTDGSTVYDTLFIFSPQGVLIESYGFTNITALTISDSQQIVVADDTLLEGSAVKVYSNINSAGNVVLTLQETITLDFAGNPLTAVSSVSFGSELLVCYSGNKVCLFDGLTFTSLTDYTIADITQISNSAIVSRDDSFAVVDAGLIPRTLFGATLTGTNTLENVYLNTAIPASGQWNNGKQALMPIQQVGYGVGIEGGVYTFPYVNGVGGVPSYYISDSLITSLTPSPDTYNAYGNSLITAPLSSILYTLDTQSNTQPLESIIQTNFDISPTVGINNFDFQNSTGLAFAIGEDNNLYKSNIPISPRVLFSATNALNNVSMNSIGVNFPKPTTTTATNQIDYVANFFEIASENNLTSPRLTGIYTDGGGVIHGCISGTPIDGGVLLVTGIIEMPSQTFIKRNNTVHIVNAQYAYGYYGGGDISGTQWSATVIALNDNTTVIQIVSGVTDSPASQLSFPNTFCYIGAGINTGVSYLAITQGTFMSIYAMTDPSSPAITQTAFEPFPYTPQSVFGICFDGADIWVSTSTGDSPPYANPSQITSLVFNSTYTNIPTSTVIVNGGNFAVGHVLTRKAECNQLAILNFDNSTVSFYSETGTFLFNTLTTGCNTFLTFLKNLTPMYSWAPITISGMGFTSCQCVAIDKNYTNLFYITDTATNKIFSGTLAGNTLTLFPLAGIDTTWQSINTIASPNVMYSSKVYNYAISNQSPKGVYATPSHHITDISVNRLTGEYLIAVSNATLISLPTSNITTPNWSTARAGINQIYAIDGADLDAGNAPIQTFDVLVRLINSAFTVAWSRLVALGGTMPSAPQIVLNYTGSNVGLVTLNYATQYSDAGNGILFNQNLNYLLAFPNVPDTIDDGYFFLLLAPTSTTITQNYKSIFTANQLSEILVICNNFNTTGNLYSSNNTSNILYSLDCITSAYLDNSGEDSVLEPNFLHPLVMSSNQQLVKIQASIWYLTKDGTQYPLLIAPNNGWRGQLCFTKRFGT